MFLKAPLIPRNPIHLQKRHRRDSKQMAKQKKNPRPKMPSVFSPLEFCSLLYAPRSLLLSPSSALCHLSFPALRSLPCFLAFRLPRFPASQPHASFPVIWFSSVLRFCRPPSSVVCLLGFCCHLSSVVCHLLAGRSFAKPVKS